jgi:hypothetical protein
MNSFSEKANFIWSVADLLRGTIPTEPSLANFKVSSHAACNNLPVPLILSSSIISGRDSRENDVHH